MREVLYYNPDIGIFIRKIKTANCTNIGDVPGGVDGNGYHIIMIDNNNYKAHRLAFLYMKGYFPENDVDHINRIKTDNRWCNLREVSRQCNMRNKNIYKNNTSGVTGVCWIKGREHWDANIRVNRKLMYLGRFKNFDKAVKARWDAEVRYSFPNCNTTSSAYNYLKENNLLWIVSKSK